MWSALSEGRGGQCESVRPSAEAPKRGKGGERGERRRQTVKDVN